jgi:membrane dipeptidase
MALRLYVVGISNVDVLHMSFKNSRLALFFGGEIYRGMQLPDLIDGHVDLLYYLMGRSRDNIVPPSKFSSLKDPVLSPPALGEGRVRLLVCAYYCPDTANGPDTALPFFQTLEAYAEAWLDGFAPVETIADLTRTMQPDQPIGLLRLLENADVLLDLPPAILWQKGFRVVGLTHAGQNRIADGNSIAQPAGLTAPGRILLKTLDRLGFAIDLAHLSDPGVRMVLSDYNGPILSSHTGFRRYCDMPRNLADHHVREIIARGGIMGFTINPEMLTAGQSFRKASEQSAGLETVFRQIDGMIQSFGTEAFGFGTDLGGYDIPNQDLGSYPQFERLHQRLINAGYTAADILRLWSGNWHNFYLRLLPTATDNFTDNDSATSYNDAIIVKKTTVETNH